MKVLHSIHQIGYSTTRTHPTGQTEIPTPSLFSSIPESTREPQVRHLRGETGVQFAPTNRAIGTVEPMTSKSTVNLNLSPCKCFAASPKFLAVEPIRSFFLLIPTRKCDFIWIRSDQFIITIKNISVRRDIGC